MTLLCREHTGLGFPGALSVSHSTPNHLFSLPDRLDLRRSAKERATQAFCPGTWSNHQSHALLYLAFASYFSFRDIPATPQTLLCFAEFLLRSFTATKSVTNALSSVHRLHLDLQAEVSAFEAPVLARWKRALPLTFRNPTNRAAPLGLPLLERLCTLAAALGGGGGGGGWGKARVISALMAVCYFSMARLSSLLPESAAAFDPTRQPTLADLQPQETGFRLNLKWSKSRQVAPEANWIPLLPLPDSAACPAGAASFLRGRGEGFPLSSPLFTSSNPQVSRGAPYLTLSQARKWLSRLLWALGERGGPFTFHSFRRGACTAAFAQGCALADIKSHGGWSSDAVKLYYSEFDARTKVALALTSNPP